MAQNDDFHVLIAGAGMAGLTVAQALKKAGIKCTVYERDKTRDERLQGYRMSLVPEANMALNECLSPELFDKLESLQGKGGSSFVLFDQHMSRLVRFSFKPISDDPMAGGRSCSRITLRNVLLEGLHEQNNVDDDGDDEAGEIANICFDKKVSHYELIPGAEGSASNSSASSSSSSFTSSSSPSLPRVVLHFADGSRSAVGSVLVGADGANSAVRAQLLPNGAALREPTGVWGIAGKVPLTPHIRQLLPADFDTAGGFIGPHGRQLFVALHLLQDNKEGETEQQQQHQLQQEVEDEEMDDEAFLWANDRSYLFWAISAKSENWVSERARADLSQLSMEELQEETRQMLAGTEWHPNLQELVHSARPGTLLALNIKTSIPVEPWETSVVTLIGDAIHSMTPYRGIGGNTAIVDARNLARALISAARGERPLLEALHDYEQEMLTRGFKAVEESLQSMNMMHMEGWFSTTLRNWGLKALDYYLSWTGKSTL